jgi:hypothetical protein
MAGMAGGIFFSCKVLKHGLAGPVWRIDILNVSRQSSEKTKIQTAEVTGQLFACGSSQGQELKNLAR